MARIIIYDKSTLRVKEDISSANTPDYEGRDDVLINPPILATFEKKYWKAAPTSNEVVNMTQSEKDQKDAEDAAAALTEKRTLANNLDYPLVDVIVALIKRINNRLSVANLNPITKQEIVDQLKADKGL